MRYHLLRKSSITVLIILIAAPLTVAPLTAYEGSSFNEVKAKVFQAPYSTLPQYKVSRKHFGKPGKSENNAVLQAAKRTLTVAQDFWDFPRQQKLFQANGICFAGEWVIDTHSSYTGQFRHLTRTPVIARASVALSGTKRSNKRAFGMALKLFPAKNRDTVTPTLNVFVMNSMTGVRSDHVLDLVMDNEPSLGGLPPLSQMRVGYRLLKDFNAADKMLGAVKPDAGFRPISHLAGVTSNFNNNDGEKPSEVNNSEVNNRVAPKWLRLRPLPSLPRIDQDDFRDELRVEHYPEHQLTWLIEVAAPHKELVAKSETVNKTNAKVINKKSQAQWMTLGRVTLTQSVTSPVCDQQLHFAHPLLAR